MTRSTPFRRLILHVGLPKTGSSALQVGLARNVGVLGAAGVHYPGAGEDSRSFRGHASAGNAVLLSRYLRSRDPEPDAAFADIARVLEQAGDRDVLLSSESMFFARTETVAALHAFAHERGFAVRAAMYVRDVVPWMVSTYAQHVRANGFTGSLDAFLDVFEPSISRIQQHIGAYLDVLGGDQVVVLAYERHRHELLVSFLREVLGWTGPVADLRAPGQVNRTLTAREIGWMRHANAYAQSGAGTTSGALALGRAISSRPLHAPEPLLLTDGELARLRRRAEPQVAWINQTFFSGEPVVGAGTAPTHPDGNELPLPDSDRHLVEVAVDALGRQPASAPAGEQVALLKEKLRRERQRRRRAEARAAGHDRAEHT